LMVDWWTWTELAHMARGRDMEGITYNDNDLMSLANESTDAA
jgi:hypothetical protein